MALRAPVGGGNLCSFYALATNAFATATTHVANKNKTTKVSGHPNKKKMTIEFDAHFADSDYETFLTTYLNDKDYSPVEVVYEDSSKDSTTTATTSVMFGYILYFGVNGSMRKVLYGVGALAGNSGDYSTADKQFESTPLSITAMAAPASYTIGATWFNTSAMLSSSATVTLASGSYGVYTFLTAK